MAVPVRDALSSARKERLEILLGKMHAQRGVRHAIVAVGRGDGTPLWTGVRGSADASGTPMTAETPFFIASVTKLFIATAILRLMEQGRLSLDDRLPDHLPEALVARLHVMDSVDRTDEITIRHLLGHATGLPEYLTLHPPGGRALFDLVAEEGAQPWGIEEIADRVRELGKPLFAPRPFDGRRHWIVYSDTNFQFLIAIIRAVTGASLQEAFDRLVFAPLGLGCTFLPGSAAASAAPAPADTWIGDDRPDMLDEPAASLNDLFSTTGDLLRFMAALTSGSAFENPKTAAHFTAHWNPFRFSFSLRPVGPGWPIEYGLGTMRFRLPRLFSPFRPVPDLVGHTGVTGSWLFRCPDLDVILTGTVGQATAAALPFRHVPRLLDALARP